MDAIDRAQRKGYMPDAMFEEWEAFDYRRIFPMAAPPAPQVSATSVQPAARLLAEQVLSMDMVTPKGTRARELARQVLVSEDRLVTALRLIEHATSDAHDDGAYHEAAHDIATAAFASATTQA